MPAPQANASARTPAASVIKAPNRRLYRSGKAAEGPRTFSGTLPATIAHVSRTHGLTDPGHGLCAGAGNGWGVGGVDVPGGGALRAALAQAALVRLERLRRTHAGSAGALEAAAARGASPKPRSPATKPSISCI